MTSSATTQLTAIPFDTEIAKLTEQFTGREWVFEEIDNWLKDKDERFFVLIGEPGVGKSALAARLTQTHENIAAYHFCIAFETGTIEPYGVLLSLAARLVEYFPDYAKTLANVIKPLKLSVKAEINAQNIKDSFVWGIVIENLHTQSPQEALDIVLRRSLAGLPKPPKKPALILIDSLDEAVTYGDRENLVTLLSGVNDLPDWVRFIVTTRPDEQRVISYLKTLKPYFYHLDELSQKSLEDIHIYVGKRVAGKAIQVRLLSCQIEPQSLVKQVTELSKGNFLYTKVLLDDIELGGQPLHDLDELPKSLDEFYYNFLIRLKPEWKTKYQIIFGILSVTKAPISNEELINFITNNPAIETAPSETQLNQALGVVKQFLNVIPDKYRQNTYRLFHKSLRDYLLDQERNPIFWCSPKDGHQSIVEYCWQYHPNDWRECDLYGLRFLTAHLVNLAQPKYSEMLHELLITEVNGCNAWFEAKDVRGETAGFLNDVSLAWRLVENRFPREQMIFSKANRFHDVGKTLGLTYRYALITSSIRSLAGNIPPKLPGLLLAKEIWKDSSQALSYTRQIPDPEQRAKTLVELIPFLSEPMKAKVLSEVIAATQAIEDKYWRAGALLRLIPLLPQAMLDEVLVVLQAIPIETESKSFTRKIYSHQPLDENDLQKNLNKARFIKSEVDRAEVLARLAPNLTELLIPDALEVIETIQDEAKRTLCLAKFAPRLIELGHTQDLLSKVEATTYTLQKKVAMTRLVSVWSGYLNNTLLDISKAMQEVLAIESPYWRAEALVLLAPHLPTNQQQKKVLHEALLAVRMIGDKHTCLEIQECIELFLAKSGFISKILPDVQAIKDKYKKVVKLVGLAPYLPEPIFQQTLKLAWNIENKYLRVELLCKLAPYLSINSNNNKIPSNQLNIWWTGQKLIYTVFGAKVLKNRINKVLRKVMETAQTIENDHLKAMALIKMTPHLPNFLLMEVLRTTQSLSDEDDRTQLLAKLSTSFAKFNHRHLAFRIAEAITDEYWRSEAFFEISIYFAKFGCHKEALKAEQLVSFEHWRSKLLILLAPYLSNKMLEKALDRAYLIEDKLWRIVALVGLTPYLSMQRKEEILEEAQSIASTITDDDDRAKAFVELASNLPSQQLYKLLELVPQIFPNKDSEIKVLTGVIPYLGKYDLEKALKLCRTFPDNYQRIKVLSGLIHCVPESRKNDVIQEVFIIGQKIDDLDSLVEIFSILNPYLDTLPANEIYICWNKILHLLASRKRKDMLIKLKYLLPLFNKLGEAELILDTYHAILDVEKWWP